MIKFEYHDYTNKGKSKLTSLVACNLGKVYCRTY